MKVGVLHTAVDTQGIVAPRCTNSSNSPCSCLRSWQLSNSQSSCDSSVTSIFQPTFEFGCSVWLYERKLPGMRSVRLLVCTYWNLEFESLVRMGQEANIVVDNMDFLGVFSGSSHFPNSSYQHSLLFNPPISCYLVILLIRSTLSFTSLRVRENSLVWSTNGV